MLHKTRILNCGGFMSRKSDERDYRPRYGLLYSNGEIVEQMLDTSQDKWIDQEEVNEKIDTALDISGLTAELQSLGGDALDFVEVLQRYLVAEKIDGGVKKLALQALEKGRENAQAKTN